MKGCNVLEDFDTDYLSKNLLKINSDCQEALEDIAEEAKQNMINMAQTVR